MTSFFTKYKPDVAEKNLVQFIKGDSVITPGLWIAVKIISMCEINRAKCFNNEILYGKVSTSNLLTN